MADRTVRSASAFSSSVATGATVPPASDDGGEGPTMASHTAKLRRHAESSGTNTLDESFVSLGTPLPSLSATTSSGAAKRDANEFLPVWQQEVRDEQGRRRLHGAFTGGFSAGYFNTVGSKEGWKPSQFKSSRGNKFAGRQQTAEDFMDEEDLEELRSATEFKTTSTFAGEQKGKGKEVDPFAHLGAIAAAAGGLAPTPSAEDEDVPSAFGADLVKPSSGRAGEKMMQKMGWKQGQGVGPRVTRRRRRQVASELGIALAEEADEEEEDGHLFAPPDRPLVLFPPRDTRAGLGYTRTHTSLARPSSSTSAQRKAAGSLPTGASFGIGAINDFEADDEDVYAPSSLSHSRTLAHDDLPSDDETPHRRSGPAPPTTRGFFRDGTPMLRNFSPATTDASAGKRGADWFKLPDVPNGWEPDPQKLWREMERLRLGQPSGPPSSTTLNADERGKILGETQLPAPPKSVFDFLSAKDRARLESIRSKPVTSSAPVSEPAVELVIPFLDPSIAVAALKGFIPFAHDPAKQRRYVLYLQHSSHSLPPSSVFSPKPDPNLKGLEKTEGVNRELEAFKLSAEMFKPMSSAMAMRFTTASTGGQVEDAKAASGQKSGLHQPVPLPPPDEASAKADEKEKDEELSTAQYAVRSGMFGHMTRKEEDWYPDRLVCKRFNVPDPHPQGKPKDRDLPKSKMDEFLASQGFAPARQPSPPRSAPTENVEEQDEEQREESGWTTQAKEAPPRPLGQVGLGDDDENQGRETVSAKRPPMDLFKAIFGDGDDDDESEAEVDDVAAGEGEKEQEGRAQGANGAPGPLEEDVAAPPTETKEPVFLPPTMSSSVPKIVDGEAASADFASFRPTFKKKSDRSTNADASVEKRKEKKKKRAMVITSFGGDEDEEGEGVAVVAKERKKDEKKAKRRKKDRPEPSSEAEDMVWVEKEAAPAPAPAPAPPKQAFVPASARVARARAADLMDEE